MVCVCCVSSDLVEPQAAKGSFVYQQVAERGGAPDVRGIRGISFHIPGNTIHTIQYHFK